MYTNIFGGSTVQPADVSYSRYNIVANLVLVWPTQFIDSPAVATHIIDVSAVAGGLSVFLPVATAVSPGQDVLITNFGANAFTVRDYLGNVLVVINPATTWYLYLIDNTDQDGTWRTVPFAGGVAAVTSVNAVSNTPNITVVGGPIVNVGTFTFDLGADFASIAAVGVNGYLVRTAANNWTTRVFIPGANIQLTNPAGTAADTTIALQPNIVINQADIGNVRVAANTISVQNLNGSLNLASNGTGSINLNSSVAIRGAPPLRTLRFYDVTDALYTGLSAGAVPTNVTFALMEADGTANQGVATNGAGRLFFTNFARSGGPASSTDNAIARFDGVNGDIQNSAVILSDANNITGVATLTATQLNVANINITGSTILSTGANDITLRPAAGQKVKVTNAGAGISALALYNNAENQFIGFRVDPLLAATTNYLVPGDGAANQVWSTSGAGVITWRTVQEMKMWAQFTGAGVTNTSFGCIVVRTGVGLYTVTPTVAFATANYVITASANGINGGAATDTFSVNYYDQVAGSFKLKVQNFAGALADAVTISVQAIGT